MHSDILTAAATHDILNRLGGGKGLKQRSALNLLGPRVTAAVSLVPRVSTPTIWACHVQSAAMYRATGVCLDGQGHFLHKFVFI